LILEIDHSIVVGTNCPELRETNSFILSTFFARTDVYLGEI